MSYLRDKVRKFGWRRIGVVAGRLLRERLYRKDCYYLFQRTGAPFRPPREMDLWVVPITAESTERFAQTFPYRPARFLRRLALGVRGFFYLKVDGTPLAYHWYVAGTDYYEPVYGWTFHLGKGEAYVFDGYVLPEHRGSSVTGQGFAHTANAARERGAETIFSVADQNNLASCKLHLHLGFELIGCLEVARILTRAIHAAPVGYGLHLGPEMMAALDRNARRKAARAALRPVPAEDVKIIMEGEWRTVPAKEPLSPVERTGEAPAVAAAGQERTELDPARRKLAA